MARNLHIFASACLALLATALPAPDPVDPDSLQCWSSLNAYEAAASSWSEVPVTQTVTSSAYIAEIDTNVPYTTLCDGRPRAGTTRYTTEYTTYDPPKTITRGQGDWDDEAITAGTYPSPSPTCTIADSACQIFQSSYSSAISDHVTNDAPSPTASPHCTVYRPCNENPDYCFIYGGAAKIYYWPVTTTNGDFCAYNGSTIFASPTNPPAANTVVTDGHTFTSPTNYLSFKNARAYIHSTRRRIFSCGGASYSDVLVPLTETLSTFASVTVTTRQESFNFENLNTIPVSAYEAQRKCRNDRDCFTIQGEYTPMLPLPTEILNLEPKEWKEAGCKGTDFSGYAAEMVPLVTPAPTARGVVRL